MEAIQNLIRTVKVLSPRQRILSLIIAELQKENPKVNVKLTCIRLAHLQVKDLEWLFGNAKDYRERTGEAFGKFVFGSLKNHATTHSTHCKK